MINSVVFDLDGTLYLGEKVVEGAREAVSALERQGFRIFYFTNNSGKTRRQIVDKLDRLGFKADMWNTYCASYAVSAYLAKNKISPVYLIGADGLKSELTSRNIKIRDDPETVSAVVVGLDPLFNYGKLAVALEAIDCGAKLIVANTDPAYPVENNRRLPGCGSIVAAVVAASGHAPDFHVGKPNTYMLELLCKDHGFSLEEVCVVGDVPESDMAMAENFQCQGVLFDPEGVFPTFFGKKAKKFNKIISLIRKGGQENGRTNDGQRKRR